MKQIAELEVTDNKKLVLSIGEFRGVERVDLRQYVKVKEEFIPTQKGINFSAEWIDDFVEMVEKLKDID
ncbi:MAG: transcriptional coactivator p15/PC4 family protein [Candidatus Caldatribacteriota bacterium]|nr:transcriptional coactivator p15/PC4 family protein [Candidatus Caldatribacteriota bacterium]